MKQLFNSAKNGTAYRYRGGYVTLQEAKKLGIVGKGTKRKKQKRL